MQESDGSSDSGESVAFCSTVDINTGDLEELLLLANKVSGPTVINMCNGTFKYNVGDSTCITRSNFTLQNGTIQLHQGPTTTGPSLSFKGSGVELANVTIIGGKVGVWVEPGSYLTLTDCEVCDAYIGVWVGNPSNPATPSGSNRPSNLDAVRLNVHGCSKGSGLGIGGGGAATIDDSKFCGGGGIGILVSGNTPSRLIATKVECLGNKAEGVVVKAGAYAELADCVLKDNVVGSVLVRGEGSKARLWSCYLDKEGEAIEGAELDVDVCE